MRTPLTWRVLTLSTGEMPMAAKIAEDKQRRAYAGQAVRLLDIPADAGRGFGVFDHAGDEDDPARLAEALQQAATGAYGEAGPAFVRALVGCGLDQARRMVSDIVEAFVAENAPPDADGQVRRAAARLGMVAAAGELAQSFGIVPWREDEAEAAAARALRDWIGSRGGTEPAEVRSAISQVRKFFELHGETRFESADDLDARAVQQRAGWRRGQGDERVWFVLPEVFRSEVCHGLDRSRRRGSWRTARCSSRMGGASCSAPSGPRGFNAQGLRDHVGRVRGGRGCALTSASGCAKSQLLHLPAKRV